MDRREEILNAMLELASQNGLGSVSMAQIAEKVGIQKPSLYNHFKSKEEIIDAMYEHFRSKSKESLSLSDLDYGEFIKERSLEEVLSGTVSNYRKMNQGGPMFMFYKVIYSERSVNGKAAGIMAEETKKMIVATKNLFYALKAYGKLQVEDIDMAAVSFAMTIHAMLDYSLDCISSGMKDVPDQTGDYIKWFCEQYGGKKDEEDVNK